MQNVKSKILSYLYWRPNLANNYLLNTNKLYCCEIISYFINVFIMKCNVTLADVSGKLLYYRCINLW